MDVFHEHIEHAFFETVEHLVGFIDENDRVCVFALPGGESECAHAAAENGIVHAAFAAETVLLCRSLDGVHREAEFMGECF